MNRTHALPPLRLTEREFLALLDYSHSYPSGITPGKRWRCLDGYRLSVFGPTPDAARRWVVLEYGPITNGVVEVIAYRPVVKLERKSQ